MSTLRRLVLPMLTLAVMAITVPTTHADFPLKDGDIWVMAGDSITAQHQHSNYFEAFCYARYNKIKFGFRNSGVGGHTIPTTLARFDYDIAAWQPTVVSVELGMNDQGGTPTEKFVANMATMVERIRGIKARPIILSASPINNGDTMAKIGGNKRLHEYADALKDFAAKEKIPYADQFHTLVDVWGKNKPGEIRLTHINAVKPIVGNKNLPGVEHLQAFLDANKDADQLVSLQGDAVHPGPPGQIMMAAALLRALEAETFVSEAKVDAKSLAAKTVGCKVNNVEAGASGLTFDRLDDCLPFPIPDEARSALRIDPTILQMSEYTLRVTNLKAGMYTLNVNKAPIATLSDKELAAGVNLTAFGPGAGKSVNPIAAQGKAILAAVKARADVVGQFRGISKAAIADKAPPELRTKLAEVNTRILALDDLIREAARPKVLRFEILPQ